MTYNNMSVIMKLFLRIPEEGLRKLFNLSVKCLVFIKKSLPCTRMSIQTHINAKLYDNHQIQSSDAKIFKI